MRLRARAAWLLLAPALLGCQPYGGTLQTSPAGYVATAPPPPSTFGATRWKAVLIAGDNSAPVFDNATRDVAQMLGRRGVQVVATFTADPAKVSPAVHLSTHAELRKLPGRARVAAGEGCLLFATSHGTRHGLRLPHDSPDILSPPTLKQIVTGMCGEAPTVLIVSACHSGTFIRAGTIGPNMIILTAASDLRQSFGCRPERRYTYYDGCVLTEFPKASTWQDLHTRLLACIAAKEASLKELASDPQAFFGRSMRDLPLPQPR